MRSMSPCTWDEVRDQLAGRFPKIGTLMDNAKSEVLAFTALPRTHWPKIWSTNPLERGLIHEPAVTRCLANKPGRVGQQRREPLRPSVHGDVVDLNPRSTSSSSTSR
jgi:hypothetical protein